MQFSCVKQLVESGFCASTVPSKYIFPQSTNDVSKILGLDEALEAIPTVDFSLLTSADPNQRSKAVEDLGRACREWGFFVVINHGVPHKLMDGMVRESEGFFDLRDDEKRDYEGKALFDPIRWGTSFNVRVDKTFFWRDFLKIHVHPHFNAPKKPIGFSETLSEYCKSTRELASELLKGISKSLGLEEGHITKKMEIESGNSHQLLVINSYPPCPQPELAMGLPAHTDHGLLTLLSQNCLCGLQVLHSGNWVPVNPPPYSFLVNVGDHLEILTNGKYKSVVHRAMVNNKATRISIGTAHGPSLDTIVSPIEELVDCKTDHDYHDHDPNNNSNYNKHAVLYRGIRYKEYMQLQQSNQLNGKSCLDRLRI